MVSEIETRLLIPQAIDQLLRGTMTAESAAEWLQRETQTLLDQAP